MPAIVKSDVIYRTMKDPFVEGVLACGFMRKPTAAASQRQFSIDYYSCFLVLAGTGVYQDEQNASIALKPGSIVQRFPGHMHSTEIVPDGTWVEFFISFGKPVHDYMRRLSMLNGKPVLQGHSEPDAKTISTLARFLRKLKASDSRNLPMMLLTAQKLVLSLQEQACASGTGHPQHPKFANPQIVIACERLSAHFQENMTPQSLADTLNMGYESFRKQFKAVTGMSPVRYRNVKKMDQAVLMLQSGLSIKEIAHLTGYGDVFAFSKQFRKMKGVSPGKYLSGK